MKLSHRFKEEDKIRFWVDNPFCVLCGSNEQCSLHHIYGAKLAYNDSIMNSSMLCHVHHKEADSFNSGGANSKEYRQRLLKITLKRATNIEWQFTDKDKKFLESVKEDVQTILKQV